MPALTAGFAFNPSLLEGVRSALPGGGQSASPLRFIDGASLLPGDNGVALVAAGNVARQNSVQQGLQDLMLAFGGAGRAIREDKKDKKEEALQEKKYEDKKAYDADRLAWDKEKFYEGQKDTPQETASLALLNAKLGLLKKPGNTWNPLASPESAVPADFDDSTKAALSDVAPLENTKELPPSFSSINRLTSTTAEEFANLDGIMTPATAKPATPVPGPLAATQAPRKASSASSAKWEEAGPGLYKTTVNGNVVLAKPDPKNPGSPLILHIFKPETSAKEKKAAAAGKTLLETQTKVLANIEGAGFTLDAIEEKLKTIVDRGPIVGAVRGANPYDELAQAVENQVNSLVPGLARGVFGEVGVLTDKDVDRYKKLIPNMRTDPKVALRIIKDLRSKLTSSRDISLRTWGKAGYDVSGFEQGPNLKAEIQALADQLDGMPDKMSLEFKAGREQLKALVQKQKDQ